MANIYFKNAFQDSNNKEWNLFNKGTHEICEIYGRDFLYLSKTFVNKDWILGEDSALQFNDAKPITMLIENYDGYQGEGILFKKFGLTIDDRLTLVVQKNHFDELIGKQPEIDDIIFYPNSNQIFKVNFFDSKYSFHQFLGENMFYKIQCVLYKYSHEEFNTNITNIDTIANIEETNIQNELTQMETIANQIIDFDEDYFGNS